MEFKTITELTEFINYFFTHPEELTELAEKKRKKITKLINYYFNNPEELNKLLGIKTKHDHYFTPEELIELEKKSIKKLPPKFKKIYTHSEIENITRQLFKTQKLNDKGTGLIEEDFITGEVKIWENKGVEYIVKVDDLPKLNGKNPKVYVSQIKNISLLMGLTQEQQFNNEIKEAKCEFAFTYYAERRGYSKEEIHTYSNFMNELKRDLLSGAYTTYRIDKIIIEGHEYTAHGIPNFYTLYEPKEQEVKWKVEFNNPYSNWIVKVLNGEAGQYFIKDRKAIEDRTTTERPYLFLFYQQLIKRKRINLLTSPVKIGNLLNDMKLPADILARPRACYEQLRECVFYFGKHYDPPEIEEFFIYNDFHKTKTVKLPVHVSEAFAQYPYQDFKGLLKAIGIKDIREAFISFKRPYIKPKDKQKSNNLNAEEEQLLDRTLNWFNDQVTKIPREDQEGIIKNYIKKLGCDNYRELFEREANKINANAVEFLTKVLPDQNNFYNEKD